MPTSLFVAASALSVLDTVPVDSGQRSTDAILASLALAEVADRVGYRRYWFAEHHNTDSVASITPAVLAAAAAARTVQIRVGSGGVMLPNHAPLAVAEQFATLEAIAPNRVDLGIGRSTGSDAIVASLLGSDTRRAHEFSDALNTIDCLLDPRGTTVRLRDGNPFTIRVTPEASGRPQLWVLGSSARSAQIAGALGLSYVYAHHFFERGTEAALDTYRSAFRPSAVLPEPHIIVTANVVVADTHEEALSAALPNLLHMARIETGQPLPRFETIEEANVTAGRIATAEHVERIAARWFIGTAESVGSRLADFASALEIDEIMMNLASGRSENEEANSVASRRRTLELLSGSAATQVPDAAAAHATPTT